MSTSHGSSTGAAGVPTGLHDTRNEYNPSTSGFNSATGAGYEKPQETQAHTAPSNSYDNNDGVRTNKVHHPPPISQRAQGDVTGNTAGTTATGSRSAQAGESLGKGVKGFAAGLHGAGESLRGAANAAVDRAFGSDESAEWNEEIARRGENEIRSKEFAAGGRPTRE